MAYVSRSSEQASIFPPNNLPSDSQVWGQNIEKRLYNIEVNFNAAEVNNLSRDSQLISNFTRLDAAVTNINNILDDLGVLNNDVFGEGGLSDAVANVTDVVIDPVDNTKINGLNLKAGTVLADNVVSSYVYAGSIAASQITAGTLTGFTIKTAASGTRVEMGGSKIDFYYGSTNVGSMFGAVNNGNNSLQVDTAAFAVFTTYQSFFSGGLGVYQGDFSVEAGFTSRLDGRIKSQGTLDAVTTAAANMYIATNGFFARTTNTSSREAKENIVPFSFDANSFINVNPVTFDYKAGIITDPDANSTNQLGFIAEDFVDAGLGEHLVIPSNDVDPNIGLRYDKLYMFLHKVVQEQHQTIQSLEQRIAVLEGN